MTTDAIVLAKWKSENQELTAVSPKGQKSLIEVVGKPSVAHVVDSLRQCDQISRIILIGDKDIAEAAPGYDVLVESSGSEAKDIMNAVLETQTERCMIITGDMPLASTEAVSDLLTCAPDADVVYPVISKTDVKEAYPERLAYYVKTSEGKFTGASCVLFKRELAVYRKELLVMILNARSNPKELLGLVGPAFALKFMLSTISLSDFQSQLTHAFGVKARVFISHYPELFVSIDSLEDVSLVQRELRG